MATASSSGEAFHKIVEYLWEFVPIQPEEHFSQLTFQIIPKGGQCDTRLPCQTKSLWPSQDPEKQPPPPTAFQ